MDIVEKHTVFEAEIVLPHMGIKPTNFEFLPNALPIELPGLAISAPLLACLYYWHAFVLIYLLMVLCLSYMLDTFSLISWRHSKWPTGNREKCRSQKKLHSTFCESLSQHI